MSEETGSEVMWWIAYLGLGIVFTWLVSTPHRNGLTHEPVSTNDWLVAALLWPLMFCAAVAANVRDLRWHGCARTS